MGIIKRQSFKTVFINYTGVALGLVFINFVFPHIIDNEYLGLVGLMQGLVIVLSSFTTLGTPHLLVRFSSTWSAKKLNAYNTLSLLLITASTFLFALLYVVCKEHFLHFYHHDSSLFQHFFYWLIPLVFIYSLHQYLEIYSLVKMRLAVPTFLKEIVFRLILILSLFLIFYGVLTYTSFSWIFLAMYLLPFIILLVYNSRIHDFKFGPIRDFFQSETGADRKEEFTYTAFMFMLVIANNLIVLVDSLMLPAFLGLAQLAVYLRPQVIGNMVNIPYRAVAVIASPVIRNHVINNEKEALQSLYKSISVNLFLFGSILAVGALANVDYIFKLLPDHYAQAKSVLLLITLARLMDMAFGVNSELLTQSNFFKQNVYFALSSMLLGILLNFILIPRIGMAGAAWSILASLGYFNLIKTWFIYKHFGFHCFSKPYIRILFTAVLILGCFYFIPEIHVFAHHKFMNALANITVRGGLSVGLFVLIAFAWNISNDFNQFIRTFLSGKIFKGGHKMSEL